MIKLFYPFTLAHFVPVFVSPLLSPTLSAPLGFVSCLRVPFDLFLLVQPFKKLTGFNDRTGVEII